MPIAQAHRHYGITFAGVSYRTENGRQPVRCNRPHCASAHPRTICLHIYSAHLSVCAMHISSSALNAHTSTHNVDYQRSLITVSMRTRAPHQHSRRVQIVRMPIFVCLCVSVRVCVCLCVTAVCSQRALREWGAFVYIISMPWHPEPEPQRTYYHKCVRVVRLRARVRTHSRSSVDLVRHTAHINCTIEYTF